MSYCVLYDRYCWSEFFHYFLKFHFTRKNPFRKFPKLKSGQDFEMVYSPFWPIDLSVKKPYHTASHRLKLRSQGAHKQTARLSLRAIPTRRFGSRSALQSHIKLADSVPINAPIDIKHVHSSLLYQQAIKIIIGVVMSRLVGMGLKVRCRWLLIFMFPRPL